MNGIPEPKPDLVSLTESLRAVIQQLETLTGQRGSVQEQAVTVGQLLDMQVLEAERDTQFNVTSVRAASSITGEADTASQPWSVAELFIFRRSASQPSTPTGGSFDFASHTLTPPAGWSVSVPSGSDPVWVSVATAAVQGSSGVDTTFTWSSPVRAFSDGQAVDMVFQRSATQPSTPANSSGTPSGWYTDVASVPSSTDPMWASVGTRTTPDDNWVWQTPVKVEGVDGSGVTILGELANTGLLPGSGNTVGDAYIISGHLWVWDGSNWIDSGSIQGPAGADGVSVREIIIYQRSASAPATPSNGSYNFGTNTLTVPSGWSATIPAGTNPVYVSLAVAYSTSPTGNVNLNGLWSSPVIGFQNGTDGQAIDAIFKRSASQPSTPSPSTGTPATWYSAVGNVPYDTNPLWMSIGTRTTPGGNWTWQTPVQVEGTTGAAGADGALAWAAADFQMGAFGDLRFTKNYGLNGAIRIQANNLFFRDGVNLSLIAPYNDAVVFTPYQTSGRLADVFYVVVNRSTLSDVRFGAGFGSNHYFAAEFNATTRLWYAIGSGGQVVQFAPGTDDAIVGIGSRPASGDSGIRTLASFVSHLKFNASNAITYFENAAITSALIQTLVADKIAAGNLVVAMNLTTGSIQISNTGAVYSEKPAYGDSTSGYFLGRSGGLPALDIGNDTHYLRFRPDTGLVVGGNIIATGNIQTNAITVPVTTVGSDTFCSVGTETLICETDVVNVSGGGVHITVYGVVDSGTQTDIGLRLNLYVDTGSGYVLRKQSEAGVRTSGGDTYFKMPIALADSIDDISSARAKITGIPFVMTNASIAKPSTVRSPVIVLLGVKR